MDSVRQQRVSKQIRKEIGDLFQREGSRLWSVNALVTVTSVKVTRDLQLARIYLSVFGSEGKQEVVAGIREKAGEIRYLLGKAMRHQLRTIPVLEFFEDDSLDYIENIERLLKE